MGGKTKNGIWRERTGDPLAITRKDKKLDAGGF